MIFNNTSSYIQLNRSALESNIQAIKKISQAEELALVVKGNAYGHGLEEIISITKENQNIDWFCTYNISEALYLLNLNVKKKILVLSALDNNIEQAILNNMYLSVYDVQSAILINKIAQALNKKVNIHIKIDTGMSRLGINYLDFFAIFKKIQNLKNLNIIGLFTHLSDTSNYDHSFSYLQLERFDNILDNLKKINIDIQYTHAISSSGIYLKTKRKYSFLRAGTLAYGIIKSDIHNNILNNVYPNLNLKPVLSWKTKIIQIKTVPKNSYIGYDKTFITNKVTKIGILPVGYYDGYTRALSNKGYVLINNQQAPILGNISMNLTTIDITNIKNIKQNTEVTLLGQSDLKAKDLAIKSNKISNEIISSINPCIKRIIL